MSTYTTLNKEDTKLFWTYETYMREIKRSDDVLYLENTTNLSDREYEKFKSIVVNEDLDEIIQERLDESKLLTLYDYINSLPSEDDMLDFFKFWNDDKEEMFETYDVEKIIYENYGENVIDAMDKRLE